MIAPANMLAMRGDVVQNPRLVLRLLDSLRVEASDTMTEVLHGVSHKRIRSADVPGVGPTFVSRCTNGGDCNPLWKIAGLFVLMKRLGMGRGRAQRIVDYLQELVDLIWPEDDVPPLDDVLDTEQDLDAEDDPHQQRIGRDPDAIARMLDVKRRQRAHDRTVIFALRRELARQD